MSVSTPVAHSATPAGPRRRDRSAASDVGALAGGQIGGNYQIGQFVIGAEGDFDWQNLRGASASGICAPAVIGGCAVASNWLATFRGRAGFAADRVLFYVTGGGAFTNIKPSTGHCPMVAAANRAGPRAAASNSP